MNQVTMADVADRAGVSKSTVSAPINDRDVVKTSTRERVRSAVEELSYRPSGSARRGFKAPAGKSIGFAVKEAQNPYYAEILSGIQGVASEENYLTFTCSSEGRPAEEKQIIKQFANKDLSGLIITPILSEEAGLSHIFDLKRSNVPFVLLEGAEGLQASLVGIDNASAFREATRHLIGQGHERVVHFAGPACSKRAEERIRGARRAFSESRFICDPESILRVGDSFAEGYERGLDYFGEGSAGESGSGEGDPEEGDSGEGLPTAVTCYNDLVALGLMKALREAGISVPEEVSVVGFGDLGVLDYVQVSLTTVRVPKREMGRRAAEVLLRQIDSGTAPASDKVTLEAELVERSSTAPPPQAEAG